MQDNLQGRRHLRSDGEAPFPLPLPQALRPGDTLIVWKHDRLGRSLRDLITMLDEFRAQGMKFQSLTEHIDTETAEAGLCGR